ncbi:MAG TPA: amino acid ABC transporter substrate-binding protein [Microvirga sp.]|jgi:general L-amino acid transport system substrate-binding protein|nr:amino acid ABC transporter substrate-binding protein [Microvirga sp.]
MPLIQSVSRRLLLLAVGALTLGSASPALAQQTLESVKQRGAVVCGASQGTAGFGLPDQNGVWRGLDVDTCRAIAVAVFGDKDKVRFVPLTGQQRLTALQTGEVDVLPRTTTWTLQRDANGVNFTVPNYYEYPGVLLRKDLGVKESKDLKGASVCVQTGSTTEVTVADMSKTYQLDLKPVVFDSVSSTRQAFFSGRCDALITDASALAAVRATQAKNPDDYVIIPANDKMEALTPAVRHGDDRWFDIVKWSFQALIMAEQLGITQANVEEKLKSDDPTVRRFLGIERGNGQALGLDEAWAYNIVKQLGNYGEIFERNVGKGSPLKLERGPNRLYRDGGLMFPLVFN